MILKSQVAAVCAGNPFPEKTRSCPPLTDMTRCAQAHTSCPAFQGQGGSLPLSAPGKKTPVVSVPLGAAPETERSWKLEGQIGWQWKTQGFSQEFPERY